MEPVSSQFADQGVLRTLDLAPDRDVAANASVGAKSWNSVALL